MIDVNQFFQLYNLSDLDFKFIKYIQEKSCKCFYFYWFEVLQFEKKNVYTVELQLF